MSVIATATRCSKLSAKLRAKLMGIARYRIAVDPHSGKSLAGPLKGYDSARLSYQDRILIQHPGR
ncbi:hypothetical protein [Thiocapsa sp. C3-3m]|uniref:hypothetical protein n=1 Tax=Thiocapsa sp. C3-3m TaxID=3137394 RepID=UPI0035B01AFC